MEKITSESTKDEEQRHILVMLTHRRKELRRRIEDEWSGKDRRWDINFVDQCPLLASWRTFSRS